MFAFNFLVAGCVSDYDPHRLRTEKMLDI